MEWTRCSRRNVKGYGCHNVFAPEYRTLKGKQVRILRCPECRQKDADRKKGDLAKATQALWLTTKKGRALQKRVNASERQIATSKKYMGTAKGKAVRKRENAKLINNLRKRLYKITKDSDYESGTLRKLTSIQSNAELCERLKATFDRSWMTWENHGLHKRGMPPRTKWQIGHIIPCSRYDAANPIDMKHCFDLENLFAQDARENLELQTKLPSIDVLMQLRHVWPVSWEGVLP
jgi:uncharacterized protein YbaR (Trm112 family)